jgi:hypothetical protein
MERNDILKPENYVDRIKSYPKSHWSPLLELIPEIEQAEKFEHDIDPEFEAKFARGIIDLSGSNETELVGRFRDLVYEMSIMIDFDWGKWDEGRTMVRNRNFNYDSVDIPTKCKLITAVVRNDRFCDGALAEAFESGLILKILKSIERQIELPKK